jgi:hypothetical protein
LARQTGFGQAHLSNFLRAHRRLSLEALDRVLRAQELTIADLLPSRASPHSGDDLFHVPLVSHAAAMFEPVLRQGTTKKMVQVPLGVLGMTRATGSSSRQKWARFVAVQAQADDAAGMEPVIWPDALLVLDRHYISFRQYRPDRPNVYAIRHGARLKVRYADYQEGRLMLRPHNRAAAVELIAPGPLESPSDLITGRVVLVINEM